MKKFIYLLVLVFVLALALRTYHLSSRPVGFTWDEAALGYNAYSLIKTARDERGQFMPLVFRSFGDYKPGLYIYTAVPTVAILGLTEFATRLPSAVAGSLLVVVLGLFVWQLFGKKIAIFSSLLLAINPWAIHFSRGAWEANFSLLLTLIGSLLFIRKKYYFSAVFLGLTFLTYQGAKLLTPLILVSLVFCFAKNSLSKLLKPGILLALIVLPIVIGLSSQSGRLVVLGVFNYTRPTEVIVNILKQDSLGSPNLWFQFFHAEFIDQLRGVCERFLNHFSPQYLFFTGDWSNLRHSVPYFGYFYLTEVVTILLGLRVLFRRFTSGGKFLILWLIFSVVPSALSRDIISGVRSLPEVIPFVVLSAWGLSILSKRLAPFLLFSLLTTFLFVYYLDLYYIHMPNYVAKDWLYPYKPALMEIKERLSSNQKVVMTSSMGQPYIFVLFYYQIDPRQAQSQLSHIADTSVDVGETPKLNQFTFSKFYWPSQRGEHNTIYIGDQFELPEQDLHQDNLIRLPDVNYPDGTLAWKIVELK